jgi:ATP synthase F1 gamma subunit
MESLRKLKEEMQFNTDLSELLDVLKGVAIAEYRLLESRKERFEEFMKEFEGFFQMMDFNTIDHPFAQERGHLAIIAVTSNEGFMGGLNTRIIHEALSYARTKDVQYIVIGDKGAGYMKSLNRKFIAFPGIDPRKCYKAAFKFKDYIMQEGLAGRFGKLVLFYPKPISFIVQKIEHVTILPCHELFQSMKKVTEKVEDVIVESTPHNIIEYLLETWITQKLYEIFEDSKLAEFSARTIHLEESYQISLQEGDNIMRRYFRTHREMVDKDLRDMFASRFIKKNIDAEKANTEVLNVDR